MRWSEWRTRPPVKEAATPVVLAAVDSVLSTLGGDLDGTCWVVWGEDAIIKWSMLMPTAPGLLSLAVRPASQDGPRVTGKLVRWQRVQIGEFSVDFQQGHKVVALSVEGIILRGADGDADTIGVFLQGLYDAIDGRGAGGVVVAPDVSSRRRPGRGKTRRDAPEAGRHGVAAVPELPAPADLDDEEELPNFLAQLSGPGEAAALPSGLPLFATHAAEPEPAAAPVAAPAPAPGPAPAPVREQELTPYGRQAQADVPVGPLGRRLAAGVSTPEPPSTGRSGR